MQPLFFEFDLGCNFRTRPMTRTRFLTVTFESTVSFFGEATIDGLVGTEEDPHEDFFSREVEVQGLDVFNFNFNDTVCSAMARCRGPRISSICSYHSKSMRTLPDNELLSVTSLYLFTNALSFYRTWSFVIKNIKRFAVLRHTFIIIKLKNIKKRSAIASISIFLYYSII